MDTLIKITTIDNKWYLCKDIRQHIWDMSNKLHCHNCQKILPTDNHIAICFVRNKNLCFTCWHKKRWPKE